MIEITVMEAYLDSIVRPLLGKPEALRISKGNDDLGILLTLDVDPTDMPHIIGKEGQTIISLRKILGVYGMRNHAKITVHVNEPVGGKRYIHHA